MFTNQRKVRIGLAAGVVVAAVGCAAQTYSGGPRVSITQDPPNKVVCAQGDSAEIGAPGGSVALTRGLGHRLHVPEGAVSNAPGIRFVISDLRAPYIGVTVEHRGPANTTFNPPLRLRLSYAGCEPSYEADLRIYRWTPSAPGPTKWIEVQGSRVDTAADSVWADLSDLSQYALGAG